MANLKEERGFFWWFDEPQGQTNTKETSVPGLLRITEGGHVTLELEGAMWYSNPPQPRSWLEPQPLPPNKWITGRLGSYGSGGNILLCGIERTDISLDDEIPSQQSYSAELCIERSSEFNKSFNLEHFYQLRVDLVGLEKWLKLESITVESDYSPNEERKVSIKYRDFRFSYPHDDGNVTVESLTYGFPFYFLHHGPDSEIHIKQTNYLTYTPSSESSLDFLRYQFNRIEELFSLLLGSYFRLDWPTLIRREDDSEKMNRVYYVRGPRPDPMPIHYFAWTNFTRLQGSFGDVLSSWRTHAERHGAGDYLYLAAMRNPLPYPEHEFVNLIWALESLHRTKQSGTPATDKAKAQEDMRQRILNRFSGPNDKVELKWLQRKLKYAHDPTLSDRIFEIFANFPVPLNEKELRRFAERCAKRRNDISHEGGPREYESYADFVKEVSELRDALRYLYHALLLSEIGVEPKIIADAMTKSVLAETRILPSLSRAGFTLLLPEGGPKTALGAGPG
jgi:ApeA N-terminal domain 1